MNRAGTSCAATWDSGLGAHVAELPTGTLPAGASVQSPWCGADGVWAGRNFAVTIAAAPGALAEPAERDGNVAQRPRPWSGPAAATGGCGA
ncbi:MAG TPA: hypothetical protein VHY76_13735 [Acetobacteraceae bacterium]|nr:hypothetical protein [Acetobacteraceae bacterium]